jgi:hypothetical protein
LYDGYRDDVSEELNRSNNHGDGMLGGDRVEGEYLMVWRVEVLIETGEKDGS